MNKFLKIIERYLIGPIVENLPFFVIFSLLLLPHIATGFLNDALSSFYKNNFEESIKMLVFNTSEVLAIAYLCCLILSHIHLSIVRVVLYIFALFLFGLNLYMRVCFGTLFTSATMLLIAETTKSEVLEFFETFAFRPTSIAFIIGLTLIAVVLISIEKWYNKRKIILKSKIISSVVAVCVSIVLCLAVVETINYANSFRNQSFASYDKLMHESKYSRMDYFRRMINNYYLFYLSGKEKYRAIAITERSISKKMTMHKKDSLSIIIIIGESFIKSHASVYGYQLSTMPYLSEQVKKGNVILYNNVITPAKYTSTSLRNFFSCNSIGDGEMWSDAPFFPAFFKASGYEVYFWDNQYDKNSSGNADFALDSYIHDPLISKLSYHYVNETNFKYDGELVEDFQNSCLNSISNKDKNSLVIFHLMGQHFKTDKRYPNTKRYCHFVADSIHRNDAYLNESKKDEIAKYDNAVLYNDYVLGLIMELFKERNAIMIFFSDHGELVYDVSDVLGRTIAIEKMSFAEIEHIYNIPMIFWFSDKYKSSHPEMVGIINSNRERPLMSDNLCQILFHIGNIHTKWYQSIRDVLSPDYQCPPRIIEDAFDYDEKREVESNSK